MIIGIAGGTCSGKSSVAQLLSRKTGAEVISQDNYFIPVFEMPLIYNHPNYDRLESVNWEELLIDIRRQTDNVIVEGFLVLADERLRSFLDYSVYIDEEADVLIDRRLTREPLTPREYISIHVRNVHTNLVVPTKKYADRITSKNNNIEQLVVELSGILAS